MCSAALLCGGRSAFGECKLKVGRKVQTTTISDLVAAKLDDAVTRLRSDNATVLLFTGPDIASTPEIGRASCRERV